MSNAKANFDQHIAQCAEAIQIYNFLRNHRYSADFGLRFVWVASISALNHYISELIVEKSTEHFSNNMALSDRILSEGVPLSSIVQMSAASPAQAVVEFRKIISNAVRFRTFQKAADVADGLAFIWSEQHKWDVIGKSIGMKGKNLKFTLNSIANRRDKIVHSADYDESNGKITPCLVQDAQKTAIFIEKIVHTIDEIIP